MTFPVRDIGAELLVMAALGCVLGVLGPFDTFALPLFARLGLWLLFAIGGYACFRPVIAAARGLSELALVPLAVSAGIACVVAAVPVTWLVAWVSTSGRPDGAALAQRYPYVLLVGLLATTIQFLLFARQRPASAETVQPEAEPPVPVVATIAAPAAPPTAATPFLDRLPPHLGRDLFCLEMEDHYVRAHTALGSTLILMRMRDAAAELAGMEGERVHRSWWVARAAVARSVQRERQTWLVLADGREVPVARNSVPVLRAAGWL